MGKSITGAQFRKMVISGANWLESNKDYVDSLNVYPVPDGDTEIGRASCRERV